MRNAFLAAQRKLNMLGDRALVFGALLATFATALVACSSNPDASVVPTSSMSGAGASVREPSIRAQIRDHGEFGVSAHYVVLKHVRDTPTIALLNIQIVDDYLKTFPASTRLSGARIVYPDGSTQTADGQGEFDAGMSSYAKSHPEKFNGKDVTVRVEAPTGSLLKTITTAIFAPSESEERKIESGVIPPNAKPRASPRPSTMVRPDGYIWSCDPNDYEEKHLIAMGPELTQSTAIRSVQGAWYEAHFYTCGTDRPTDALEWSGVEWTAVPGTILDRWKVFFIFKPGFTGEKIALWWSPSNYFFRRNIHDFLIDLK
jgi:hypothetical protein